MGNKGNWTRWETEQRELTWSDIWKYTSFQLQFLLRAVYDVLPTPTNLRTWGLTEDPMCTLCQKPANLEHILSSCQVALTQGRYTWRHNQVLRALAHTLETERKKDYRQPEHPCFISFVRSEEQTTGTTPQRREGILSMARDWELRVDLEKKLIFPPIVETTQRPEVLLISDSTKKLVVIELTVPWETRCQEAHERKHAKYEDLLMDCREAGWQTWNSPVEVGARGFPAASCWKMMASLGMSGRIRKRAVSAMAMAAERASSWLWLRREDGS